MWRSVSDDDGIPFLVDERALWQIVSQEEAAVGVEILLRQLVTGETTVVYAERITE